MIKTHSAVCEGVPSVKMSDFWVTIGDRNVQETKASFSKK